MILLIEMFKNIPTDETMQPNITSLEVEEGMQKITITLLPKTTHPFSLPSFPQISKRTNPWGFKPNKSIISALSRTEHVGDVATVIRNAENVAEWSGGEYEN